MGERLFPVVAWVWNHISIISCSLVANLHPLILFNKFLKFFLSLEYRN